MRASDVSTLTVRAGAHNLKNSANEEGTQNIGVKLVVKHKDFTMQTLVRQMFERSKNYNFNLIFCKVALHIPSK